MEKIEKQSVFTNEEILDSDVYVITQEVFNAISHGIGFILALLGTGMLVNKGFSQGSTLAIVAYVIYGVSMCLLFFNSTMYHSLSLTKVGPVFRFYDHMSIYLLIAGTYTPFALLVVGGRLGWVITILEWLIAIVGIVAKARQAAWIKKYSTLVYLAMGWLVIFALKPLITSFSREGLLWLLAGGILYTVGTYFYSRDDRYAYFHVIWHFFVLAAAFCMFISVYFYI